MRVLFPLRSNAAQFAKAETSDRLRDRPKRALLIHDEVIMQDGRLQLIVWEDGTLEFDLAPGAIPGPREDIRFISEGQESSLEIRHPETGELIPLLEGPVKTFYEADYPPVARETGCLAEDFFRLTFFGITDEGKKELKSQAARDFQDPEIRSAVEDRKGQPDGPDLLEEVTET